LTKAALRPLRVFGLTDKMPMPEKTGLFQIELADFDGDIERHDLWFFRTPNCWPFRWPVGHTKNDHQQTKEIGSAARTSPPPAARAIQPVCVIKLHERSNFSIV
jgi:hypothetical protein